VNKNKRKLEQELFKQTCISCTHLKCRPFTKRKKLSFHFNLYCRCVRGCWKPIQDTESVSKFRTEAFKTGLVLFSMLNNPGRYQEIAMLCGNYDGE